MEAAIRSSAQVGGPLQAGQRGGGGGGGTAGSDNGPSSQQQQQQSMQQQSTNISPYMQRISSGESPIHRPVDTPQSYSKGGIGAPPQQSRSAASPLSPPRPGPGAANTYPRFADVTAVREAPHRYVQHNAYSIGGGPMGSHGGPNSGGQGPIQQYRETSYARIPQMSSQAQEYRRAAAAAVAAASGQVIVSSSLPIVSVGPANTMDSLVQQAQQQHHMQQQQSHSSQPPSMLTGRGGQRISLIPTHPSDSMSQYAVAAAVARQPQQQLNQQTSDPGGPYKKMRLGLGVGVNVGIGNVQEQSQQSHSHQHQQVQLQTVQQQINAANHLPSIVPAGATILNVSSNPAPNLAGPQQPVAIVAPIVQTAASSTAPPTQQLKVDTREHRNATTEAYHPQVEAISPTLPNDPVEERRTAKDELLLQINKVDMEINETEKTMAMLKKKAEKLEQASSQKLCAKTEETQIVQPKHRSLASKCYAENKKRAEDVHSTFDKLGPPTILPLYNQPSDVEMIEEQRKRHELFKNHLLLHIKKIRLEKTAKNSALIEKYTQMTQEWQKRVEKAENSAKRKAKEAKNREFFEKVFTELRKQREDKERFNRVGSRIKSEADLEEIMDGLQEQAIEEKKMRSYAVIPPLMLDIRERRFVYHNENGAMPDMVNEYKDRQNVNVWTTGEKEIFKEKFLQHPKNFGVIAASLDRKSAQDCVRYYYLSKKTENYKQLLRKSRQRTRSSRNPQKTGQQQVPQCIVDSLTTGVTTRLQREQQQKTGGRDRTAQSTATTTTTTTTSSSTSSTNNGGNSANSGSIVSSTNTNGGSTNSGSLSTNSNVGNSGIAGNKSSSTTGAMAGDNNSDTIDNSASTSTTTQVKLTNEGGSAATNSTDLGQSNLGNDKDEKSFSTIESTQNTSASSLTANTTTNSPQSNCIGNGLSNTTTNSATTNSSANASTIANGTNSSITATSSSSSLLLQISTMTTTTTMSSSSSSICSATGGGLNPVTTSAVNSLQATIQKSEPILIDETTTTTSSTTSSTASTTGTTLIAKNRSNSNTSPTTTSSGVVQTSFGTGDPSSITSSSSSSSSHTLINAASAIGCNSGSTGQSLTVVTQVGNSTAAVGSTFSNTNNNNSNNGSNINLKTKNNSSNINTNSNNNNNNNSNTNNNNNSNNNSKNSASVVTSFKDGNTAVANASTTNIQQQQSINTPNGIKAEIVIAAANAAAAAATATPNSAVGAPSSSSGTLLSNDGNSTAGSKKDNKDIISITDDCSAASSTISNNNNNNNNSNNKNSNAGIKTKMSDIIDGSDNSDVSEAKKKRLDSDASSNPAISTNEGDVDSNVTDSKDKLHPCFVCKTENCPRTRPLKKGRGQQYGIADESIPLGARVCNSCQCKSVRSRYPNCPLPTCPNSKERAKRLHNIPSKLFDAPPEIREPILQEFKIAATTTRCCSACLMRIRRKLDPHIALTEDRQILTDGDESDLSTSSCDERDMASSDTASVESPNNPMRQNILLSKEDQSVEGGGRIANAHAGAGGVGSNIKSIDDRLLPPLGQAPRKQKAQEEYDSSATETADEENENSPAAIPNGPQRSDQQLNVRDFVFNVIEFTLKTGGPKPNARPAPIDNRSGGGGGGTASNSSTGSNSSSNSNSNSGNTDVQFIGEFRNDGSVVGSRQQSNSSQGPSNVNTGNASNALQVANQSRQQHPNSQNDNLATLSIVNSHSHLPPSQQQIIQQHQHGISATITPVKPGLEIREKDEMIYSVRNSDPEPQTLDLSIKKPSKDVSIHVASSAQSGSSRIPQQHQQSSSVSALPIYRSEQVQPSGIPQSGPPNQQSSPYLAYHHPTQASDLNRPSKSPAVYVSQVPVNISQSGQALSRQQQQLQQSQAMQQHQQSLVMQQQQQPQQQQTQPQQTQQHQQHQQQQQQQQHQHQQQQNKSKLSQQKLSPKVHPQQQSPSPNQMIVGGPKGSITHGTPVNSQQQQILVQGSTTLSPRFDGILRQTPPSSSDNNKLGSITQGTPVHLPSHHMQDKQRVVYDYYKNNRQSPAQQPSSQPPQSQQQGGPPPPSQQSNSAVSTANFVGSPYGRSAYGLEPQPQLSTRQIVMHDYMTSQQMHGQQRNVGRSDKESSSPRSSAGISNSPASIYYTDKDRARADYLSRTSPAEHINSTPSPHRTPPPQRQGVIQRHNTGGSKPPSPSPNRLHLMPHIYPPSGHEAFNSLVDVAVQQPQLPVPQRDEKRGNHPSVDHAGNVYHDLRSQQIAREQMAMQLHQQQQQHRYHQQQQAAVDLQRREQYNRERIHAQQQQQERDRQERDRQERDRQERERIQAERERIDRERERERREREEQEREEARRRETARMIAASTVATGGPPPFLRADPSRGPITERDRDPYHRPSHHPGRPSDGTTLSAASLIDAIIKHQINQGSSEPPSLLNRDGPPRPSFYSTRDQQHSVAAAIAAVENNGKSNSPNVINIDLDSGNNERSNSNSSGNSRQPSSLSTHSGQPITKSMTLGEVTDSIITKEYGPNPLHLRPAASTYMTYLQDPIVTTDQWNYKRRMQKEAEAAAAASVAAERNKGPVGPSSGGSRSATPDERQIIRMAQPPSPRNKYHEIIDGHYYQAAAQGLGGLPPGAAMDRRMHPPGAGGVPSGSGPTGGGGGGGPSHQFALDCYVKNRIVEAMRTEDDRRPDDGTGHGHHGHNMHHDRSSNDTHGGRLPTPHGKEGDGGGKVTPSGYDEGRRSNSSSGGLPPNDAHRPNSGGSGSNMSGYAPPVTTFATTTYAYPYSALNVTGPPPPSSLVGPQSGPAGKCVDGGSGGGSQNQQTLPAEPKPLLSAQYEALSDEE